MKNELSKYVPVFTVESWEDFDELFRGCGSVVFRGQGDSSWELTTNYERAFGTNCSRESEMLHRCIAGGHLFIQDPPQMNDHISWLAEMQHYGAPTRLLDVTRSKYIALFFALMGMKRGVTETDGAVWALDTVRADSELYKKLQNNLPHIECDGLGAFVNDGIRPYKSFGWKIADAIVSNEPAGRISICDESLEGCKEELNGLYKSGMVIHLLPKRINRRLQAQQGEFLFPFNINKSFVQNLLGAIGGEDYVGQLCDFGDCNVRASARTSITPNIIKALIPYSLRDEFVERLLEMNISYQTLFPDEMGFMQSLQYKRSMKRTLQCIKIGKAREPIWQCNEFLL